MDRIIVKGGQTLKGEVTVEGAIIVLETYDC